LFKRTFGGTGGTTGGFGVEGRVIFQFSKGLSSSPQFKTAEHNCFSVREVVTATVTTGILYLKTKISAFDIKIIHHF
jgi:hypothetical protein